MRVIDERGLVYDSRYICHTALSNQKYALPNLKKYPLPDRAHVKSAIKFFNYVSPRYEKTLAYAILKRMSEYGMSFDDMTIGDENRFKKYIPKREYLAHHGILGMEWGKKNGPPYPLGASDHSAAEKKAGWQDSLNQDKQISSKKSFSSESFSTSDGRLSIVKHKTSSFAKIMAKHSKSAADVVNNNFDYSIKDKQGNKVGYLSLTKENGNELNVNWISIKSKQRGNKYAQSVMNTA